MLSPGLGGGGSRGVKRGEQRVTFKNMVPAQIGPMVSAADIVTCRPLEFAMVLS